MKADLIFLFPGQGSQSPRMGWELNKTFPACRRIFEEADDTLGRPLTKLIFEGRADEVRSTDNLQPAISAVNAACLAALRERGFEAPAVAGHSVGEYSACYAAGVFSFPDLMRLTAARGQYMAASAIANPGGMAAVVGLAEAAVKAIVAEAASAGVICIANLNSDDQIVISGDHAALSRAADLATSAGARKFTALNVSGAWHSPLVSDGRPEFEKRLQAALFQDAVIDVYPNVLARPARAAATLRDALAVQYDSAVLWSETMRAMMHDYPAAEFVEVGPGRVLTGLLLGIDRRRVVHHVDSPASLDTFARRAGADR